MTAVTIEEAQQRLAELINQLQPGESVRITRGDTPVAELTACSDKKRKPRRAGSAKDKILFMAEDFDAPLEDFAPYEK